jgi:hypothetical protein
MKAACNSHAMESEVAKDNLTRVSARCNELLASNTSLEEEHKLLIKSINSIQSHFLTRRRSSRLWKISEQRKLELPLWK